MSNGALSNQSGHTLERGVRNAQILGVLSLYQNHKISQDVEALNENIAEQTELLQSIAGSVGEISSKIDDVKHEQRIQRLKQERDEMIKETIFNFKQECDALSDEQPDAVVHTYFRFRALELAYESIGISTKDISNITDKEYFVQIGKTLTKRMEAVLESANPSQREHITNLDDLSGHDIIEFEQILAADHLKFVERYKAIELDRSIPSLKQLSRRFENELNFTDVQKIADKASPVRKIALLISSVLATYLFLHLPEYKASNLFALFVVFVIFLLLTIAVLNFGWERSSTFKVKVRNAALRAVKENNAVDFERAQVDEITVTRLITEIENKKPLAAELLAKYSFMEPAVSPYITFVASNLKLVPMRSSTATNGIGTA